MWTDLRRRDEAPGGNGKKQAPSIHGQLLLKPNIVRRFEIFWV